MGLSLSKRITQTLSTSQPFLSSCTQTFNHSLSLSQHAFPGLLPYQLLPASLHLHTLLHHHHHLPILTRWAPPPPTQSHVDSALNRINFRAEFLDQPEFQKFAVELYKELVMGEIVRKVALKGVPIGAAGIAGVGMVVGGGVQVVGRVAAVYAVGVAASVWLSLS